MILSQGLKYLKRLGEMIVCPYLALIFEQIIDKEDWFALTDDDNIALLYPSIEAALCRFSMAANFTHHILVFNEFSSVCLTIQHSLITELLSKTHDRDFRLI